MDLDDLRRVLDVAVKAAQLLKGIGDLFSRSRCSESNQAPDDKTEHILFEKCPEQGGFLMPIEDIFYLKNRGTVVTGVVWRGQLTVNDAIEIVGLNTVCALHVRGIEVYRRRLVNSCEKDDNVGLLLSGGGDCRKTLGVGCFVAHPHTIQLRNEFVAVVYVLTDSQGGIPNAGLRKGDTYHFWIGATFFPGKIVDTGESVCIKGGEAGLIKVCLDKNMGMERGMSFVFRNSADGADVGVCQVEALL